MSDEAVLPALEVDLSAIAGSLVAPVMPALKPELRRIGVEKSGIQRFTFQIDIPASERSQAFVLRSRVRLKADQSWLALPLLTFTGRPSTWRASLRRLQRDRTVSWDQADPRLARIFSVSENADQTGNDASSITLSGIPVRFELLGAEGEPARDDGATTLHVVFKPQVAGGWSIQRIESAPGLAIIADDRALAVSDESAEAQELFERIITLVHTLSGTGSHSSSP